MPISKVRTFQKFTFQNCQIFIVFKKWDFRELGFVGEIYFLGKKADTVYQNRLLPVVQFIFKFSKYCFLFNVVAQRNDCVVWYKQANFLRFLILEIICEGLI